MAYYDKLVRLPEGFVTISGTRNAEFAGIAHQSKPIFGSYPLSASSLCMGILPEADGDDW